MPSVSATENPEIATQVIKETLAKIEAEEQSQSEPESDIEFPEDSVFDLPGGYVGPDEYIATEFEVRELTGRDEEAISRAKSPVAVIETLLKRGLVRVGEQKPDESILNALLAGDRDYILLCIFAVTFGRTVRITRRCPSCNQDQEFNIDVLSDVPIRRLESVEDRGFVVECSRGEVKVLLPTGVTQKKIQESGDKTMAELSTLLLASTVIEIGDRPVLSEADVQALPIRDRRKIADEIAERAPGPRLMDTKADCPCGETDVEVPLSMGSLFQY